MNINGFHPKFWTFGSSQFYIAFCSLQILINLDMNWFWTSNSFEVGVVFDRSKHTRYIFCLFSLLIFGCSPSVIVHFKTYTKEI